MSQNNLSVAIQFDDAEQQHWAASFGMWVFLGTEVMFFGGLFVATPFIGMNIPTYSRSQANT